MIWHTKTISSEATEPFDLQSIVRRENTGNLKELLTPESRSEERRVGKEC